MSIPDHPPPALLDRRALNLVDRLPKRLWPETRRRLREVWSAPTRATCEQHRDELGLLLYAAGQDQAAEKLYRDWNDFVTFCDFPAEHRLHLRASNAIESVLAGVRLRTNVARRARAATTGSTSCSRSSSVWAKHWRVLNGGATVMTLVLAGERFVGAIESGGQHERRSDRPDRHLVEGSSHAS